MVKHDPKLKFCVETTKDLEDALLIIDQLSKPVWLTISLVDEARSLKQNRLSFSWYKVRGDATGHGKEYERSLCKLLYGIPILQRDEKFASFYQVALSDLSYENKMLAMEYVPVTSLMSIPQFAEYLSTVDEQSASIGIVLPRPEDLYWAALMIEAEKR